MSPTLYIGWATSVLYSCGTCYICPRKSIRWLCTRTYALSKWSTEWWFLECGKICTSGALRREVKQTSMQASPALRFFKSKLLRTCLMALMPCGLGMFWAPNSKKVPPSKSLQLNVDMLIKAACQMKQHLAKQQMHCWSLSLSRAWLLEA